MMDDVVEFAKPLAVLDYAPPRSDAGEALAKRLWWMMVVWSAGLAGWQSLAFFQANFISRRLAVPETFLNNAISAACICVGIFSCMSLLTKRRGALGDPLSRVLATAGSLAMAALAIAVVPQIVRHWTRIGHRYAVQSAILQADVLVLWSLAPLAFLRARAAMNAFTSRPLGFWPLYVSCALAMLLAGRHLIQLLFIVQQNDELLGTALGRWSWRIVTIQAALVTAATAGLIVQVAASAASGIAPSWSVRAMILAIVCADVVGLLASFTLEGVFTVVPGPLGTTIAITESCFFMAVQLAAFIPALTWPSRAFDSE